MFVLFESVRLLDPVANVDRVTNVLLKDGVIQSIDVTDLPPDAEVRSLEGCILAPGLIDLYSHSGEPGFEERETLRSLCDSAIAGGFAQLNILPDTTPAIDNPTTVAWIKNHAPVEINCWGALTIDANGQQMSELADLAESGIVGFADGHPISNLALLRRLLEYLQPLQKPIALWACDLSLSGAMREGANSIRFGLPGIPAIAETAPLSALLECVAEIGTPVHLMRISTARSVELIRSAKARGVPITASTTWLHLLLDSRSIESYDPNLRLDPPLGNERDRQALIEAVAEGVIDAIAIDHTPYTYEEKTVAFGEAPPGAIGLELALPLLWQALVKTKQWSALELWRSMSVRSAACLGQSLCELESGARWVLFDPNLEWTVERSTLRSKSINTAWFGKQIVGRVVEMG